MVYVMGVTAPGEGKLNKGMGFLVIGMALLHNKKAVEGQKGEFTI